MTEVGLHLLLWLGSAWLHATCLLALVWLAERSGLLRAPAWREWAWRCALLLPLASAAVQTLAGNVLPAPRWWIAPSAGHVVGSGEAAVANSATSASGRRDGASAIRPNRIAPMPGDNLAPPSVSPARWPRVASRVTADPTAPTPIATPLGAGADVASAGSVRTLWALLGLVWALVAGACGLRLLARWSREARRIAALPRITQHGVCDELRSLCVERRIRPQLRCDRDLPGPAAWAPDTVCLPPWALQQLNPAQRRATLAHELAHLLRRDPQWQLATRWLAAVLCSPLSLLAQRRLAELAEHACDAWAVTRTGNARALAESLLACAERQHRIPPGNTLAVAMAGPRSPLVERIHRLILEQPKHFTVKPRRRQAAFLAGLFAACLALPGLAMQQDDPPPPPTPPSAPAAPAAATAPAAPPPVPTIPAVPAVPAAPATRGDVSYSRSDWLFGSRSELQIRRPGYRLDMEAEGDFSLTASEDDIAALDDEVRIEETRGDRRRAIRFVDRRGAIEREYRVDNRVVPLDSEGRTWLAEVLPRLLRETGINAEQRVAAIHARGGVDAVFGEIALIESDHGTVRYIGLLLALPHLDAAQLGRAVAELERIDSDYELRVALGQVLDHPAVDGPTLDKVLALASALDSDYERRLVLQAAADRLPADPAIHARWLQAMKGMESDYEQRLALEALLKNVALQPELLVKAAEAIDQIGSDYEQRVALQSLATRIDNAPAAVVAYARALRHIDSDYERRVAVQAVLEAAAVDASGGHALLEAIAAIDSDYECRLALQALAERLPADPALIARYRDIARDLGDYERAEAERALDRLAI